MNTVQNFVYAPVYYDYSGDSRISVLGSHVECLHLNRMLRGTFTGKEYQLLTRS
jgi:hypothetical protein